MQFKQANRGNYKKGRAGTVRYIVIHYTANNGDTAFGNASYFAQNAVSASAHYFVDENEAWQSVKDGDTAFHCGAKRYRHPDCRNGNAIGVELCSRKNSGGKYYFKDGTVQRAADLTRSLMKKYGVDVNHVLRHYDVTGKNCPAPFVENGAAWKNFLNRLREDDEVEKQIKIKLNGVVKSIKAIEKNGYNYVKLQDLRDGKLDVDYDRMPIIRVK